MSVCRVFRSLKWKFPHSLPRAAPCASPETYRINPEAGNDVYASRGILEAVLFRRPVGRRCDAVSGLVFRQHSRNGYGIGGSCIVRSEDRDREFAADERTAARG